MPELPEVETIRRDLLPLICGRTITAVRVAPDASRVIRDVAPVAFAGRLVGRRIDDLARRGKYLLFRLSGGLWLVAHLRMTGALLHRSAGAPADPYVRAVIALEDATELRYADLRKLGQLWLVDAPEEAVGALGPEPLDAAFTAASLRQAIGQRKAPIKSVLMDQRALAGLGNIYADEALFAARIHPLRQTSTLSEAETTRLHRAIRRVLNDALANRGSSFRDYVDAAGREGTHHLRVKVFRRTGQKCYVCGAEIARIKVGGRSTHFCPHCQPAK
ncbi:MAG: bifunctional DNA-formamidopyrimidine glycosylase/DNA-(apurinic or apyrimidinic site) lyase [Dehalococcoidia bacterium]|jgi:formamidopyrimidine-DNA glycosylase